MPCTQSEYPFTTCTIALAVYHAYTAQTVCVCLIQELYQELARRITVQPVQVETVLHGPMTVPEFAQGHARDAGAGEFDERGVACAVVGQGIGYVRGSCVSAARSGAPRGRGRWDAVGRR